MCLLRLALFSTLLALIAVWSLGAVSSPLVEVVAVAFGTGGFALSHRIAGEARLWREEFRNSRMMVKES